MVIFFIMSVVYPINTENMQEKTTSSLKFGEEFYSVQEGVIDENYVLGPGDSLVVVIKGRPNYYFITGVARDGNITLQIPSFLTPSQGGLTPSLGSTNMEIVDFINADGVKIGNLPDSIKKSLSKYMRVKNVKVSIWGVRRFKIAITGNIENPGSYIASPLMRLYDIVEMAGGISSIGDMTNVDIINKKDTIHCNLFKYIMFSDTTMNPRVKEGDIIYVHPLKEYVVKENGIFVKKSPEKKYIPKSIVSVSGFTLPIDGVSVTGEVKNPGIYPWIANYRAIDYVTMAGGLTENADIDRIVIERDNKFVGDSQKIEPGDVIYVNPRMWTHVSNFIQITSLIISVISIMFTIK